MNRLVYRRRANQRPSGIILLVVLSALTFFGLLIATYLVFSNQSRRNSFVMSRQKTATPDINQLLDEALMTLVRGTSDPFNPFYGEDLLSDYYGHSDSHTCRVRPVPTPTLGPWTIVSTSAAPLEPGERASTGALLRIPLESYDPATGARGRPVAADYDDVLTGRLITFLEGPLKNRTYRVLRSVYRPAATPYDDVFVELHGDEFSHLNTPAPPFLAPGNVSQISRLIYPSFYADAPVGTAGGFLIHMNGVPQNSRGVGFNAATNLVDEPAAPAAADVLYNVPAGVGFDDLPMAIQPNHILRTVNKAHVSQGGTTQGDFDEGYDAADFNNWFLAHRMNDPTGVRIIPSFHRPSVLNYILNQDHPGAANTQFDWTLPVTDPPPAATIDDRADLIASLVRGTFRPLPIAANQLGATSSRLNERVYRWQQRVCAADAFPFSGRGGNESDSKT